MDTTDVVIHAGILISVSSQWLTGAPLWAKAISTISLAALVGVDIHKAIRLHKGLA